MDNKLICLKMGLKPETVNIDKENRMLNGVVAIEPMDVKDWRPFSINQEFINDLVAAGKKQAKGVKSHFGHNYSNEGLLLGRASNWRVEDGKAKFDLKVEEFADASPKMPGMGNYVFQVLGTDEDALMNSIVFREQYFYQETADGQKVKCYYYDKKSGSWINPNPELGKVYPKLGTLYSTDIVSEGAATNSMFSNMPQEESKLQRFFNTFKEFFTLDDDDESGDIKSQLNKQSMDPTNPTPAATPAAAEESAEMKALREELADAQAKLAAATPPPPAAPAPVEESAEMKALRQELADAKAKLAATPAATPVALQDGAAGGAAPEKPLWELSPENQKAAQYFSTTKTA